MKYVLITLGVIAFVLLMTFSWVTGSYNGLVQLQTEAQTQNAQIEAQLQRRWDLINQMVGSTKGALRHEEEIYNNIAKQQAAFINAQKGGDVQGQINASEAVTSSIGALMRGYLVVQTQFPNQQALQFVQNLQVDIEGSENRISVARQRYNEDAQKYNQKRRTFPTMFIASFMNFGEMPLYKANVKAQDAPTVNLEK